MRIALGEIESDTVESSTTIIKIPSATSEALLRHANTLEFAIFS